MSNLTISTCWTIATTERTHEGFGGIGGSGYDVRDRQLADAGITAGVMGTDVHAPIASKSFPGSPAWRPPTG